MRLRDKVAIITGGANGIGKATAAKFLEEGAVCVIADVNQEAGIDTAKQLGKGCTFMPLDVSDMTQVESLVAAVKAKFGKIDVLVNNAGIMRDKLLIKVSKTGEISKLSPPEFDKVIEINLKGVYQCTQAVAEVMIPQGSGVILNASSIVGLDGNFGQTNYVATKAGVVGMTKVWARELGRYGIRVNAVAPGYILTDMLKQVPEDVLATMATHVPLKRLGQPEDIANVYSFLASDEAAYINGAVIRVDGGAVAGT